MWNYKEKGISPIEFRQILGQDLRILNLIDNIMSENMKIKQEMIKNENQIQNTFNDRLRGW